CTGDSGGSPIADTCLGLQIRVTAVSLDVSACLRRNPGAVGDWSRVRPGAATRSSFARSPAWDLRTADSNGAHGFVEHGLAAAGSSTCWAQGSLVCGTERAQRVLVRG